MRWKTLQEGNRRKVVKFLLIPRAFNGECRWLEYATMIEVVVQRRGGILDWEEIGFSDDPVTVSSKKPSWMSWMWWVD